MINDNTINKILLIFHYERIHNIQFPPNLSNYRLAGIFLHVIMYV